MRGNAPRDPLNNVAGSRSPFHRHAQALQIGVSPYVVLQARVFQATARANPRTVLELKGSAGIGPRMAERYDAAVLNLLREPTRR